MIIARVFQYGNSQVVRLPKEFRFDIGQVEIFRRGEEIVQRAVSPNATTIFDVLAQLPEGFMENGRGDTPPQKRDNR